MNKIDPHIGIVSVLAIYYIRKNIMILLYSSISGSLSLGSQGYGIMNISSKAVPVYFFGTIIFTEVVDAMNYV